MKRQEALCRLLCIYVHWTYLTKCMICNNFSYKGAGNVDRKLNSSLRYSLVITQLGFYLLCLQCFCEEFRRYNINYKIRYIASYEFSVRGTVAITNVMSDIPRNNSRSSISVHTPVRNSDICIRGSFIRPVHCSFV